MITRYYYILLVYVTTRYIISLLDITSIYYIIGALDALPEESERDRVRESQEVAASSVPSLENGPRVTCSALQNLPHFPCRCCGRYIFWVLQHGFDHFAYISISKSGGCHSNESFSSEATYFGGLVLGSVCN